MGLTVILVECDVVSPAGAATTLRFSDRAIYPMAPDDATAPNRLWDERLIEPPTLRRTLFDDLQGLEPGFGVGEMVLANADRALDPYQGHAWGEVRVWRWTYGQAFATAGRLISGTAAGTPDYDLHGARPGRVRLTLFDYRIEIEKPIQTEAFSGANDGVTVFYEGGPELAGKMKPLAWGDLTDAQIPAPLVNPHQQVFMLHAGEAERIPGAAHEPAVLANDRGGDAGLGWQSDVSHLPDAFFDGWNLSPTPSYGTQLRRGLLKMFGSLVGSVTFGLKGDKAGGYAQTPGPVIAKMLARAGVPPERIGASIAAADSAAVVGAWTQDSTRARELVAWVARSAPMAVLPDRTGVWQAVMLEPPAATADLVIVGDDLLALEPDEAGWSGVGEVSIGWGRIWTTYRREQLQVELQDTGEETRLRDDYRYAVASDPAFQARFPSTWRRLNLDTALRRQADAEALATHLQGLFGLRPDGRPRRRWRATVELTDAVLEIDLGQTVEIDAPASGVHDRFLLIGEEPLRPRRDQTILTLWG